MTYAWQVDRASLPIVDSAPLTQVLGLWLDHLPFTAYPLYRNSFLKDVSKKTPCRSGPAPLIPLG